MTALSTRSPTRSLTVESISPLRVLHLNAGNLYGGIERVLAVLADERQVVQGMTPSFGLCFPGRLRDELISSGVQVFDFGPVRLSRPWTVSKARRALHRALLKQDIDVVVTHGFWSHVVFGPAVRRTNVALVHWSHGPLGRGWVDRLGTWTSPDLLLANSRFTADSFKNSFPGVRREVVGLPARLSKPTTDLDARNGIRSSLGAPTDAVVIVMVSRIEPLKGHAVLLAALSALQSERPWECWIVGGAQRPQELRLLETLKRQAAAAGIEPRVRFLGARNDVGELLRAADIYCQPNTGPDSFGLSFIEALDAGLPVVTSRIGGPVEFLDDTCSILTPPGDAAAVARALRELIDDLYRRRALGRNGPARARSVCDPADRLAALQRALASLRKAVQWA